MPNKPRRQGDNIVHIQRFRHHNDDDRDNNRDHQGREDWTRNRQPPPKILPPPAPMAVARVFVKHSLLIDGVPNAPTLRYWRGGWWLWRTTHWVEVETRTVRSLLYRFTEHAVYDELPELAEALGIVGFLSCKPWEPNRNKIGNLLEALSSIVILPDDTEQPYWIDHRESGTVIAVSNGLLDLVTRDLWPHTPQFFNLVSVPFAYEPHATRPQHWLNFQCTMAT